MLWSLKKCFVINEWNKLNFKALAQQKTKQNKTKKTINKKKPTEWEKLFANDMTDNVNIQNILTAYRIQYHKQATQSIGQNIWKDIFPKQVRGWLTDTWKDA